MKSDQRYLNNETDYLKHAQAILSKHFFSDADFDRFYTLLSDPEVRNALLRVTSFYRYLVRDGEWVNELEGEEPIVVDYLTNSYKCVSIFSLVESLSDRAHQDFYTWLSSNSATIFPITAPADLSALYNKYSQMHGATNQCAEFFGRLPSVGQHRLMQSIRVPVKVISNGKTTSQLKAVSSVKRAVQVLYGLRSRFVHEASLLVQMSSMPVFSKMRGKMALFELKFADFARLFEEALIMHFAAKQGILLRRSGDRFACAE